jgi:6-phospho-beta-glucosidase
MGLRIAVVGAGSTYTPELVEGFARRADRLPVDELVLLDPDLERLEPVAGLTKRMLQRAGTGTRLTVTDDRSAALDGADFVILQLRIGGQAARHVDETLPHRFGVLGQETTGPGGFAKALRTVPVVLEVAEEAARRASPGAWIVDFTNPVGIVTQALLDAGARAIGLCNVAIGLQRRLAAHFGVAPERVDLEHVGLNHLTWERAVRVDGEDRLPELLAHDGDWLAQEMGMPVDLMRDLGAIPSYYLRYFYQRDEVLAKQRQGRSRAEEVAEIERDLLELYRDPALDHKPELLEQRGGAFYSEAAAQLIASLHLDQGDVQVVNVRNNGALPGLPASAVVEIPARIDATGATPLPLAPLAPELRGLVQAVKAYEELAVEAAITGDRKVAVRALLAHPLVGRYELAHDLVAALLDANRPFLPRFGGTAQRHGEAAPSAPATDDILA